MILLCRLALKGRFTLRNSTLLAPNKNFSDSSDSSSSSSSDDSSSSDSSDEEENESTEVKRTEEQKRRVGGMGASERPPRSADHPDSKGVRANRRN